MAEKKTYKLVGRYPNEAISFGATCRVEFHNFVYTTQNPVEIAAIESSSMFQDKENPRIMRVDGMSKQGARTGKATTTESTIGLKTPLDSNKDSEIEALRKENAALKAENSELSSVLDAKASETVEKTGEKGDGDGGTVEDPMGSTKTTDPGKPEDPGSGQKEPAKTEDDPGKKKQEGKK